MQCAEPAASGDEHQFRGYGAVAAGAAGCWRDHHFFAVEHLTCLLDGAGALSAIRLKCKYNTKRKKKIAAAIYFCQVDNDGE